MIKADKIAVGWSLEAALFAFMHNCPLIVCSDKTHTISHTIPYYTDLSKIKLENDYKELDTNFGIMKTGSFKRDILPEIHFRLSLLGNLLVGTAQIHKKQLLFRAKAGYNHIIEADEIIILDPEGVGGLKNLTKIDTSYEVHDHSFAAMLSDYDVFLTGYKNYCQEIWFYRASNSRSENKKDINIVSYLIEEELNDPDYYDNIMRLMASKILSENGMECELDYMHREVFENNVYKKTADYNNIKFKLDLEAPDILEMKLNSKAEKFLESYYDSTDR